MNEPVVRPWSGKGLLFRDRGLIVLVAPGSDAVTRELLAAATASVATVEPGAHFCRSVTRLLADRGTLPALCSVGATSGGTALLVHGRATITAGDLVLDGSTAITVAERVVPAMPPALTAALGGDVAEGCPWSELSSGVIRAGGFQLSTPDDPVMADAPAAAPEHGTEPPPVTEPAPAPFATEATPRPTAAEPAPALSATDSAPALSVAEPAPVLPVAEPAPAPSVPAPASDVEVLDVVGGVRCCDGHFNDPGLLYCGVCGIGLTQAGFAVAQDARSALGVLVLDDGTAVPLDRDHLLGRAPGAAAGTARPVTLNDPLVSDVHAFVRLRGWGVSVVDAGSSAGTFVRDPETRAWQRVADQQETVLRPGALIAVGGRQLRYETNRAA